MRINNNISSMHTQGALFMNNRAINKDLEKLSTGLRVNRASDDAAGLSISEGLRAQVRGAQQAKRNALDGISALNIAEGAMNEIHAILQRQRELAVQSANATYTSTERAYMDAEFQALTSEINRIVSATNFNGLKLLGALEDDTGGEIEDNRWFNTQYLQVDANSAEFTQGVNFGEHNRIQISYNPFSGLDFGWTEMNGTTANTTPQDDNGMEKGARIGGTDGQDAAQSAIRILDNAIVQLSSARADIGAIVNRLESAVNNLTTSITNQQAAESQIRDVDFAFQASKFTTNQILVQSATSMLSQANASTQGVLALLR